MEVIITVKDQGEGCPGRGDTPPAPQGQSKHTLSPLAEGHLLGFTQHPPAFCSLSH